jgi:hypothetical protein
VTTTQADAKSTTSSAGAASSTGTSAQDSRQDADWAGAVAQVRSASGWVVKAFAAIAVALVGTSPLLVNLGDLGFNARGIVAATGALIALGAIGLIISWATDVNLTEITDVVDLTTDHPDDVTRDLLARISSSARGREVYLGGKATVDELLNLRARMVKTYERQLGAQSGMTEAADRAIVQSLIDGTVATLDHVDSLITNLQNWVTYRKIRDRFDAHRRPTMFAGAAAVLGIVLWLAGLGIDISGSSDSSSSTPAAASSTAQGTIGTLKWTSSAKSTDLRHQLGLDATACATATVVQEGGTGDPTDPWQVSIVPNQTCVAPAGLGSFTVDRRFATFTALTTAPTASVTISTKGSALGNAGWLIILIAACALTGAATYRGARSGTS